MSTSSFHILIIGGGLGGLCLAQGLKKAGISVAVYERDRTQADRLQGYRIHIEPRGNRALHACLPPRLFDAYLATSGSGGKGLRFSTERLKELCFINMKTEPSDPVESSSSVSRITLRQVLLAGLDEVVHFDKTFTHYQETPDGKITAFFEDGTSASGDVLVAADGSSSRVRKQVLPYAQRVETGVLGIMGKLPLTDETRGLLARAQLDAATVILGPKGLGMFVATHDLGNRRDVQAGSIGGNDEATLHLHPGLLFDNTSDYTFWAFVARQEKFSFQEDPEQMAGPDLQEVVLHMVRDWNPSVQQLIRESDPSATICKPLRTSRPIKPWETKRITLVGDAIHSMTPAQGIGGNTALHDASLLCQNLVTAHNGEKSLLQAIHDYEAEMVTYGFAAVRASRRSLDMIVMENPVARAITKALRKLGGVAFSLTRRGL